MLLLLACVSTLTAPAERTAAPATGRARSPYASTPSLEIVGTDPGGGMGSSLVVLGDSDGDGYDDLAVGDPEGNVLTGSVFVYPGGPAGIDETVYTRIDGLSMSQYLGYAVAGGDFNGDGYADLAAGSMDSGGSGRIDIYAGAAGGISTTSATTLTGPSSSSFFGYFFGAGDVNGDGYADLVAGATGADVFRGEAYVYYGSATGLDGSGAVKLDRPSGVSNGWGTASTFLGDVDNDGYGDFGVCGPSGSILAIFHGSASGVATAASATISIPTSSSSCDHLAPAGDVDGDGYDDVLVGNTGANSYAGQVLVYHGSAKGVSPSATTQLDGTGMFFELGMSLAGGDLDGDGYADAVAGGPWPGTTNAGEVYGWPGSAAGVSTTDNLHLTGTASDEYGHAVALGDLDGNGGLDLIVGAPTASGRLGLFDVFLNGVGGEDTDGDGWYSYEDCDDADPARNPGEVEVVGDGVDSDCDGFEDCGTDEDDDGFRPIGDVLHASLDPSCSSAGEILGTAPATDCDDTNGSTYPGAYELPGDGVDQDCDGVDPAGEDTGDSGEVDTAETGGEETGATGDSPVDSEPVETADSGDDAVPTDTGDTGKADEGGCGCASGGGGSLVGVIGALGLLRRRRRV